MGNRILKIIGISLLGLLLLMIATFTIFQVIWNQEAKAHFSQLGKEATILDHRGRAVRDLNKNGKVDPYEDPNAPLEERVENLLTQMTPEEKAGCMFINMALMDEDGMTLNKPRIFDRTSLTFLSIFLPTNVENIADLKMNHFNTFQSLPAETLARWNNHMQKMAEKTRLGIPVTIATDPRHGTGPMSGPGVYTSTFSKWPGTLGLAAARDTALARSFGEVARHEYLAVGIRMALHPMADLATEPRWARIRGTFGEDADLAAKMSKAYILGFQGDSLGDSSVACMAKYFACGGPQESGEDPQFPYGKNQIYDYHLGPFEEGVLPANPAAIMPYYGIPRDQTEENVGFSFNKEIISGLLRKKYGYEGVVCTDWGIISNLGTIETRAWEVEKLSEIELTQRALEAGFDMFGGASKPDLIIDLVENKRITEARIDTSVRRILRQKFLLGLFDNPYVKLENVHQVVTCDSFVQMGREAQRQSLVMLKNQSQFLPLSPTQKIYVSGIDKEIAAEFARVTDNPQEADVIIMKRLGPYDKSRKGPVEKIFHAGRISYSDAEKKEMLNLLERKPSILCVELERPAILTDLLPATEGLLVHFGMEDKILLQGIFGMYEVCGKLPFELPRNQEAVEKQKKDLPYDSENPLFPFGFGL